MRETFLERYLAANLGRYDGAVFFFCHQNDDGRRALLVRAAQAAERRIVDVRELDARFAELAASCGQFAFFVSFSMLDELEHYLNTCPQGGAASAGLFPVRRKADHPASLLGFRRGTRRRGVGYRRTLIFS